MSYIILAAKREEAGQTIFRTLALAVTLARESRALNEQQASMATERGALCR